MSFAALLKKYNPIRFNNEIMGKLGKTFTSLTDNLMHGHKDDRQKVSAGRTKLLDFHYD